MKTLVTLFAVLALATAAVTVAGCGETILDSENLEETLPKDLKTYVSSPVESATCPTDLEVEKGKKFSCEITLKSGEKQTVILEFLNDDADYGIVSLKPDK
jgi:hypothetical protein